MLQLGIRGLGIARFKFNPISWFLKGEPGAWYDPSDFQPNWRRNLLTYTEDFSNAAWGNNLNIAITPNTIVAPDGTLTGSKLIANNTLGFHYIDQSIGTATGTYTYSIYAKAGEVTALATRDNTQGYVCTFNLSTGVATGTGASMVAVGDGWYRCITTWGSGYNTIDMRVSPLSYSSYTGNGYSGIYIWGAQLEQRSSATTYQKITNGIQDYYTVQPQPVLFQDSAGTIPVTAVEQPVGLMKDKSGRGNHAFQATAGNRPVLSARVNLLTKTEGFSDAVWGKPEVTISPSTLAPDGTLTANKLIETSTSASEHYIEQEVSLNANAVYTDTIYVKDGGTSTFNLTVVSVGASTTTSAAIFSITSGVITTSSINGIITASSTTSVGNGWYKCSVIYTLNGTVTSHRFRVYPRQNGVYTGDGTSGIYIWHPDLRPTNSGALLPPYQRVNTAIDYDTVGFPLYLKANGTSSAMSTNSINFSSTDKMTVVTGVRKVVDQSNAVLMESALIMSSGNPGSFVIHSPLGTTANYTLGLIGVGAASAVTLTSPLNYLAPISNVLSGLFDLGATTPNEIKLKVNGVFTGTQTGDAGSGNFGNYPFCLFARGSTSNLWFNGQFYGAIIRGAQSDTASVVQTENYMATKTGITF